jgi:hypothetical protein
MCDEYTKGDDYPVFFLRPTWAWKPLLMVLTERREPHDSHDMKKMRFSFVRSVSGLLHVLHVTYSTMYRRRTCSICFCWKRPLMTRRAEPSTEPVVPISANINWMTCSGCRCMRLQMSLMFVKIVFLLPSRASEGGAIVYRLPVAFSSAGFAACRCA